MKNSRSLNAAMPTLAAIAISIISSNLSGQCSTGVGGMFAPTTATMINTDTGTITPPGGVSPAFDGVAFNFTDINIPAGVVVSATGVQALILLATGNVTIVGDINASGADGGGSTVNPDCGNHLGGAGGSAGAGGFDGGAGGGAPPGNGTVSGTPGNGPGAGGNGVSTLSGFNYGGGGGAGHMVAGSPGAIYGTGGAGAGGVAYASLPPLIGGSGGGGGSISDDTAPFGPPIVSGDEGGSGGGGGGGAVRILAGGAMTVNGAIDASGGKGGDRFCNGGAGGGGAGGAVELLASSTPTVSTLINVAGGIGGDNGGTVSALGGNGAAGRFTAMVFVCIPPPTCMIATPFAPARDDVSFAIDASSPSAATVDLIFEFSLDGGATYLPCTASPTSPLTNPALATPTGPATFEWDTRADTVGVAAIALGVLVRVTVDDGVSPAGGLCVTAPFDVDNTALCGGVCGDCDQTGGVMATIIDALVGAQISAGLVVPTMAQAACCDVDADMDVDIIDGLRMAQFSAGLPLVLVCL